MEVFVAKNECAYKILLHHQMYLDNQLGGLGTPAGIFGSAKSPKFLFGGPTLRSGHLS